MTEKVAQNSLVAGDHGTTYGGNPLACAAISKVLDLFEENNIVEHVQEMTPYLEEKLDTLVEKYDVIESRRGLGLMQGLICKKPVAPVLNECLSQGMILINAGANIIRFLPPLVLTKEHIDEMYEKLDAALQILV